WANHLRSLRRDMQGVPRIATNLSTNELTWEIMWHCPALKEIAEDFAKEHAKGLKIVARDMGIQTAESLEAHRYIEALRQLLATQRFVLVPRLGEAVFGQEERQIGWFDDQGVYLLPDLAYRAACELLRDSGGLNGLSKNTLHKQLDSLGLLVNKGEGGQTIPKKCGHGLHRVLHLEPNILDGEEEESS
ncbi:MAG: hypothetical protein KY445_07700, partial [Armatimonadetes bacterium]|nr:hypothetical protein [Armatimonadota bacterium]